MTAPRLIGTYTPPAVRMGGAVACLYRDADCVVTGLHDGRIPWPRVRAREHRGGSGLWVNEVMLRAIRTESAGALKFWFGVGTKAVWNWRRAFGVGRLGTTGSKAAHLAASKRGGAGMRDRGWTDEECDAKAERARRVGQRVTGRWDETGWTAEELSLLGTASDEVVARKVGRTRSAVRSRRSRLKIPPFG